LSRARVLDVVLREVLGEVRIDAGRDKAIAATGHRLLVRALNRVLGDRDLLDLAFFQLLLKLTVGNRLDLPRRYPDLAQPQHTEHRDDQIPDVEMNLSLLHSLLFASAGSDWTALSRRRAPARRQNLPLTSNVREGRYN